MSKYFSDTNNVFNTIQKYEYPFPMGIGADCFSKEIYEELAAMRPTWEYIAGDKKEENNKRIDLNAMTAYHIEGVPEIWKDFIDYHTSPDFYAQILKHFGGFFHQYYPNIDFIKLKSAPRYADVQADIWLDCQIGINTPVKEKSTVSKPHLDSPKSVWAGLLYMREPDDNAGGHFKTFKCRDLPIDKGKRQIEESGLIESSKIFYNPNLFVCFMNSPFSIHSVTDREITDKPRLFVNFTLEFKDHDIFDMSRMQCQQ